jgi:hypothetical protein
MGSAAGVKVRNEAAGESDAMGPAAGWRKAGAPASPVIRERVATMRTVWAEA